MKPIHNPVYKNKIKKHNFQDNLIFKYKIEKINETLFK